MDNVHYKVSDVPALFEDCSKLSWEKFSAQCSKISPESALEIYDTVVAHYNKLPARQRFYICTGPWDGRYTRITSWTNWQENGGTQRAEDFVPSNKTILAQNILHKAGISHWLTWLDSFEDHTQVTALLLTAQRSGWDLLQAFALSCSAENTSSIRTILFCFLVSNEWVGLNRDVLADTIREHDELLLNLCLEVLTDFRFQIIYTKNGAVYDSIATIYANNKALACLENTPALTIGVLSAWAKLLSLLEPTQEQLNRFRSAYFDWVTETNDYMFLNDINGQYYKREIDFLNFLIHVFAFDDDSIEKLKYLWEKKTCVYYRWNSNKKRPNQQWFQHIGLILWLIGVERHNRNGSMELVAYVLKRMNDAIPMMLLEHDYQLLLCNIFCASIEDVSAINVQLCNLIYKIYEPSLLYAVVNNYLGLDDPKVDVLYAMQDCLQVMCKLPQKEPTTDLNVLTEKLLCKIKSFPAK